MPCADRVSLVIVGCERLQASKIVVAMPPRGARTQHGIWHTAKGTTTQQNHRQPATGGSKQREPRNAVTPRTHPALQTSLVSRSPTAARARAGLTEREGKADTTCANNSGAEGH